MPLYDIPFIPATNQKTCSYICMHVFYIYIYTSWGHSPETQEDELPASSTTPPWRRAVDEQMVDVRAEKKIDPTSWMFYQYFLFTLYIYTRVLFIYISFSI